MKKMTNAVYLEGRLYQHNLELRVSGENSKNPGTQYIRGTIDIATDDKIENIVTVHYTYEAPTFSSGSKNSKFETLKGIIDGKYLTVMSDGADVATKVRVSSSIGLNDFYSARDKDENGEPKLVSGKRNDGGFITILATLKEEKLRNTFDTDIVITGFTVKEATESYPEKGIIRGAIFDFRGNVLPVSFSVLDPKAIAYFEGLDASGSNPVFTRIKGKEVNASIKKIVTVEGAFGDEVHESVSNNRDWVVTWAAIEPYEFDSEETLTKTELAEALKARETMLAELKGRFDESQKNKAAATPATASGTTFDF